MQLSFIVMPFELNWNNEMIFLRSFLAALTFVASLNIFNDNFSFCLTDWQRIDQTVAFDSFSTIPTECESFFTQPELAKAAKYHLPNSPSGLTYPTYALGICNDRLTLNSNITAGQLVKLKVCIEITRHTLNVNIILSLCPFKLQRWRQLIQNSSFPFSVDGIVVVGSTGVAPTRFFVADVDVVSAITIWA